MRMHGILWMTVVLIGSAAKMAWAGACTNPVEQYFECLESKHLCDEYHLSEESSLECIAPRPLYVDWATEVQKQIYSRYGKSVLRDRIKKICERLLDSSESTSYGRPLRIRSAEILATYGYHTVRDRDLFEILVSDEKVMPELYAVGALGDPRILPYLKRWFYHANALGNTPQRGDIINCLYHISGNLTVQVAEEFLLVEREKEYRTRLMRIAERKQ